MTLTMKIVNHTEDRQLTRHTFVGETAEAYFLFYLTYEFLDRHPKIFKDIQNHYGCLDNLSFHLGKSSNFVHQIFWESTNPFAPLIIPIDSRLIKKQPLNCTVISITSTRLVRLEGEEPTLSALISVQYREEEEKIRINFPLSEEKHIMETLEIQNAKVAIYGNKISFRWKQYTIRNADCCFTQVKQNLKDNMFGLIERR